jgi:hypothetical protein
LAKYGRSKMTEVPLILRVDIARMCRRTAKAMRFYMELHTDKGQWQERPQEVFIEGVLRNFHDFYKAYRLGDEREMMAEGIGVINNMAMFLDVYAAGEMQEIQDWQPVLQGLREPDGDC